MTKTQVVRTGTATVDGKTRPVRQLADGTLQWSNRTDPRKGKWTTFDEQDAFERDVDVEWTTSDDAYTEVAADVADRSTAPVTVPLDVEDFDDFAQRYDDTQNAQESDDASDDASVEYTVIAMGATHRLLFPLGDGTFTDARGFATLADVDAFLATNLRSAWAISRDGSWKRRGVHLLTVTDSAGTVVKTHDPRRGKVNA